MPPIATKLIRAHEPGSLRDPVFPQDRAWWRRIARDVILTMEIVTQARKLFGASMTTPSIAEIESKIAHLEQAAAHLITYGLHEASAVVSEIIADAKAHVADIKARTEKDGSGGGADNTQLATNMPAAGHE